MPGSLHSRSSPTRRGHVHEVAIAAGADYRIRNTPLPASCADRPSSFLAQLHSPLPSQLHVTVPRCLDPTIGQADFALAFKAPSVYLCNSTKIPKYRNPEPEMHTINRCVLMVAPHTTMERTTLALAAFQLLALSASFGTHCNSRAFQLHNIQIHVHAPHDDRRRVTGPVQNVKHGQIHKL